MTDLDSIIIGGGFYGASLASYLAGSEGEGVALLEAGGQLLQRASYVNQARVHHGYHYPRSLLTGLRSSLNYTPFVAQHADSIDSSFPSYYAIARNGSKVTADQFIRFCNRVGAPLEPAEPAVARLFDARRIERVFRVQECAFDAARLRARMTEAVTRSGVALSLGSAVQRLRSIPGGVEVSFGNGSETRTLRAGRVFSCVYSRTNRLLADSGIAPIPLKHEVAEVALVELPPPFDRMGVTVMCGPFFSFMPFPPLGLHSFTHVRYTPHAEWSDRADTDPLDPYAVLESVAGRTRHPHMLRDAIRYLPGLAESRYHGSLWEIKTVLPRSEMDDSRPILFRRDQGMPQLSCVLGSKIDCIYDVLDEVRALPARRSA